MSRWSSNNEEPMSHYLNNSCYRALWKYPDCGGEYISSIRDMATGNVDCVYCSMKEVLPGVNSFAVLHPDLMNGTIWITICYVILIRFWIIA